MPSAYCGDCDWQHRADGDEALSRAMIDHFVETGHSPVERCDPTARSPTDDSLEPADRETTRTHDQ